MLITIQIKTNQRKEKSHWTKFDTIQKFQLGQHQLIPNYIKIHMKMAGLNEYEKPAYGKR